MKTDQCSTYNWSQSSSSINSELTTYCILIDNTSSGQKLNVLNVKVVLQAHHIHSEIFVSKVVHKFQ